MNREKVIDELRRRTRPMHEALERTMIVTDPQISLEVYRAVLRDFVGLYRPIESRIPAYQLPADPNALPGGNRGKKHLLERDLAQLGLTRHEIESIPVCDDLPMLKTRPQQFGCMYVVEGSTLGGQLIVKHLHNRLGLDAASGAAFFASYGDRVGTMWRAFLDELDSVGDTDDAVSAIVETACATFESFQRWLTRSRRDPHEAATRD